MNKKKINQMNKILKRALIIPNLVLLGLAICWIFKDGGYEPYITAGGLAYNLVVAIFDKDAANILARDTRNKSKVTVKVNSGDSVEITGTDNSEIDIDTK